jgi:hypothetical protein
LHALAYFKGVDMDSQNGRSKLGKEEFAGSNTERFTHTSLKEISLEDRRNEAKKPLFLTRYE